MIEMMSNDCGPIRNRLVGAPSPGLTVHASRSRRVTRSTWPGLGQLTSVMTGG